MSKHRPKFKCIAATPIIPTALVDNKWVIFCKTIEIYRNSHPSNIDLIYAMINSWSYKIQRWRMPT